MDILTTFYIEAYKQGLYGDIAIGRDSEGNDFFLTPKQIKALELLHDDSTLFLGFGGSARCFVQSTFVNTDIGYKEIQDVNIGDNVLSFNSESKILEYKKVVNKYSYKLCGTTKMINFGNKIISTNGHRFFFRGKWTEASELKKRALETRWGQLLYIFVRSCSYIKSQKFWEVAINETSKRWKWLSSYGIPYWWEKYYCKNPQGGRESVYSEYKKIRNNKPQEFRQVRQSGGKFGMDEFLRQQATRIREWSAWSFIQKRRKTTSKLFKTWFGQWFINIGRIRHYRNKAEIHSKKIYKKDVSKGVFSIGGNNKGCCSWKYVEARELTILEILRSKEQYHEGVIYDLEVSDNHSYCVTEENIIAHNSGKTLLECFWIIFQCLSYPGVAYGLGRKELSTLRKTVLITLFELLSYYCLEEGKDYKYQEQKNKLEFKNGSVIFLIDMIYQPSDPLYTRFGGLELTGAAVDESNESDINAIGTLFSRCGWKKNVDYGIKKKMLETFNPDKSHVYSRYFAPFRDGSEGVSRKFIPALPSDNPHPAIKEWIEDMIAEGDNNRIQRLVYGNFDFDDNPDSLVDYPAICDLFGNDHIEARGNKTISADLAMSGRDSFVAGYWHGNVCTVSIDKNKATGKSIEQDLRKLMQLHGVYNSNVVGDSDGLGNYLESYIRNIRQFRGNKRASNAKDFDNIKSECAWKLSEMINKRQIRIICTDKQEEAIKQELSVCLKRDNLDSDTQKKKLIKKQQMKKELGRSPDYFDMLLMQMVFNIKKFSVNKIKVKLH